MIVVYKHIRLDTNEVFYVGIGSKTRANSKHGRSKFWKRIVSKTDYIIEILHENITKEEACKLEKEYINKYGRRDLHTGSLCNMTDGGDGAPRRIKTIKERQAISKRMIGNTISGDTSRTKYTNENNNAVISMSIFI